MTDKGKGKITDFKARIAASNAAAQQKQELLQSKVANALTQSRDCVVAMQEVSPETVAEGLKFADMYTSTLNKYILAKGGKLEITAVFPEGKVKIEKFAQ